MPSRYCNPSLAIAASCAIMLVSGVPCDVQMGSGHNPCTPGSAPKNSSPASVLEVTQRTADEPSEISAGGELPVQVGWSEPVSALQTIPQSTIDRIAQEHPYDLDISSQSGGSSGYYSTSTGTATFQLVQSDNILRVDLSGTQINTQNDMLSGPVYPMVNDIIDGISTIQDVVYCGQNPAATQVSVQEKLENACNAGTSPLWTESRDVIIARKDAASSFETSVFGDNQGTNTIQGTPPDETTDEELAAWEEELALGAASSSTVVV